MNIKEFIVVKSHSVVICVRGCLLVVPNSGCIGGHIVGRSPISVRRVVKSLHISLCIKSIREGTRVISRFRVSSAAKVSRAGHS